MAITEILVNWHHDNVGADLLTWSQWWPGGSRWRWLWTPPPPGPCLWADTTPACFLSAHIAERKHQNEIKSTASVAEGKSVHEFFADYVAGGVAQAGWISPSSLWRSATAGQIRLGEERWGRGGDSARRILDHIHRLRYHWKGFLPWYEMLVGHTGPTGTQTDVCSWKAEGALVKSASR